MLQEELNILICFHGHLWVILKAVSPFGRGLMVALAAECVELAPPAKFGTAFTVVLTRSPVPKGVLIHSFSHSYKTQNTRHVQVRNKFRNSILVVHTNYKLTREICKPILLGTR